MRFYAKLPGLLTVLAAGVLAARTNVRAQVADPSPFISGPSTVFIYDQFQVAAVSSGLADVTAATNPAIAFATSGTLSNNLAVINGVINSETAIMSATASFGLLTASGTLTTSGAFAGASFGSFEGATPEVMSQDTITVTGPQPVGTVVIVPFTLTTPTFLFSVTGDSAFKAAELVGTLAVKDDSTAGITQGLFGESYSNAHPGGPYFYPIPFSPLYSYFYGGLTSVTLNEALKVGNTYEFASGLYAFAQAGLALDGSETANSITLDPQAYTLIDLPAGTYTTGSRTTYATAVPEPSTYAAILGVATLGFAVMQRKRRAA